MFESQNEEVHIAEIPFDASNIFNIFLFRDISGEDKFKHLGKNKDFFKAIYLY